MATFRVGDLIKEQPDGSRALQTTLTGSDNVVKAELTGSYVENEYNLTIPAQSYRYTPVGFGEGYNNYIIFVINLSESSYRVYEHIDLPDIAYREVILEGNDNVKATDVRVIKNTNSRFMVQNRGNEEIDITLIARRWN